MTIRVSRQAGFALDARIMMTRSQVESRGRPAVRARTTSWWRSKPFSATRSGLERVRSRTVESVAVITVGLVTVRSQRLALLTAWSTNLQIVVWRRFIIRGRIWDFPVISRQTTKVASTAISAAYGANAWTTSSV